MKYKIGDVVKGKVISVKSFGAFISLDKNTTGLLHISEISHDYVKEVSDVLSYKEEVDVKILDINESNKQIIFSIKALTKPKRKTKNRARNTRHEAIMETNKGFSELAKMLPYWIDTYHKGEV